MTFPARPSALRELIRRRLDDEGMSFAEAARRGGMSKATLVALERSDLKQIPRPETILSVARALALPTSVVQDAIAECLGLKREPMDDETSRDVMAMLAELSEAERRMALAHVSVIYRTRTAG